jgi:protein-S-isoprenylcysteine O-methyltransferase Ste14
LYTTGSALLIALGLIAANWFLLTLAIVGMFAIRALVVPMEERELTRRFGARYQAYRQRTGAMLPRLL